MLNRVLLGLLISVPFVFAQAQGYLPLVVEGAHWKICQSSSADSWPCGRIFEYYIGAGDTIVEGLAYKNLYIRDFAQNGEPGGGWNSFGWPLELQSEIHAGFIREDVSGRKVYWRDNEDYPACESGDEEILLYDFALEVGDSTYTCLLGDSPLVVQQVGTEEHYGVERTVYYYEDGTRQIEGIGFETGLLVPPTIIFNSQADFIIDYCVGNDMDCGVVHKGNMINPYHEWHLINESYGFGDGSYSLITVEYRLHDTIQHDGHIYFKLQLDQGAEEGAGDWVDVQYNYSFRQDGGRIYRYPGDWWPPEQGEKLIYNFDLEVGEEFPLEGLLNYLQPMIVRGIDTVMIDNGELRRRIDFAPEEWQGGREWYWLEGIGANDHPFFPEGSFVEDVDGPRQQIQCFYRSTDLATPIWHNPEYLSNGCYTYIVNTEEAANSAPVIVYPNPSTSYLVVSQVQADETFTLYTSLGQALPLISEQNGLKLQLDISRLPAGIYYWELSKTDSRLLQTGKVVKN